MEVRIKDNIILQLKISGVDWSIFAASLQEEVNKIEGVELAEFNLITGRLKVEKKGLQADHFFGDHRIYSSCGHGWMDRDGPRTFKH